MTRPSGTSLWSAAETERAILKRSVVSGMYDGRYSALAWYAVCGKPCECGSTCCLPPGHVVPCESACDEPGQPGSCSA